MAGIRSLDLPTSPRAAVFRAMESIVRENTIFGRIVKPDNFRTWQGHPRDSKPFDQCNAPAMRWTPMNTGETFRTPDTMAGDLLINCEIICRGSCCDDLTNFWWMLTRCFYPPLPQPATRTSRRFKQPAPGPGSCSSLSRHSTRGPMAFSSRDRGRSRSKSNAS